MKLRFISALVLFFLSTQSFAYEVFVRGADEARFKVKAKSTKPVFMPKKYDAVIVGGGLAGLTAALYLADAGKSSVVIEMLSELGGLAAGGSVSDTIRYARGASYFTDAYEEELKILERIGMGNYKTLNAIPEPIDNFFWNGKLHVGLWEDEETMKELPTSFEVLRHELKIANDTELIPNQPIEEAAHLDLDKLSAKKWIENMPATLAKRSDDASKKLYARFKSDPKVNKAHPMKDVLGLIEIYCRSALGTTPERLSAVAFANFYISEIETRFTTDMGTGGATEKILSEINKKSDLIDLSIMSTVIAIENDKEGVTVKFDKGDQTLAVKGKYAVFASPLKFAPKIIQGFSKEAPLQTQIINEMKYAHYNVHEVFIKGHPYRAAFDTWTLPKDYSEKDFTDLINGRWMNPDIKGYEGMRDFKKNPSDDRNVLSIYHPIPLNEVGKGYTREDAAKKANYAVKRMLETYGPMLKERYGTKIEIESVETNRWPYSIHVAAPGHFIKNAKVLRKPFKNVFFANNNLGTPAFEEAFFRGHCAANNILKRMDGEKFKQESWTKCILE